MFSMIFSLLVGICVYLTPLPLILPIFGAALGANAILKERKMPPEKQRKWLKVTSYTGVALCCGPIAFFLLG
ncbi:hypothetical protein ACO0LF_21765 [Undibacterium sp. Di27W]|uniref:hypothetical protein n=1 Tax=Undibacterium sp. Di27W TaxID=3413036 RepID=UPI003BF36CF9